MRELKDVIGSKESAKELIIGKDTVYIHTNIRKYESKGKDFKDGEDLYIYDEIQVTKDEYLESLQEKVETADNTIADLMMLVGSMGGEA